MILTPCVTVAIILALLISANGGSNLTYSGPRFDGCGYQRSVTYTDHTSRIYVDRCPPPGFPEAVPLIDGQIAGSYVERGDSDYRQFDVVVKIDDVAAASRAIASKLKDAGFVRLSAEEPGDDVAAFSNSDWLVTVTFTSTGLHGATAEYFVSPRA